MELGAKTPKISSRHFILTFQKNIWNPINFKHTMYKPNLPYCYLLILESKWKLLIAVNVLVPGTTFVAIWYREILLSIAEYTSLIKDPDLSFANTRNSNVSTYIVVSFIGAKLVPGYFFNRATHCDNTTTVFSKFQSHVQNLLSPDLDVVLVFWTPGQFSWHLYLVYLTCNRVLMCQLCL